MSPDGLEPRYRRLPEEERRGILRRLRRRLGELDGVEFAYVHGGFLEREFFRDVDVAVWVRDPERALHYEVEVSVKLETELGLPVDLHVLNEAPLPFKYHVFTTGELLLSRDEELRLRVVDRVVRNYIDLRELVEKTLERARAQVPARRREDAGGGSEDAHADRDGGG